MKKLIIVVFLMLIITGCEAIIEEGQEPKDDRRFLVVYYQGCLDKSPDVYILKDKKTGFKYLFMKKGYGAGLVKLED